MTEEKAVDVTDGDATREFVKQELIPGYDRFDDFIKVSHA